MSSIDPVILLPLAREAIDLTAEHLRTHRPEDVRNKADRDVVTDLDKRPVEFMSTTPLLLVDGHNLLWRAFFGFPARVFSRDKTRDLTGQFGFFALLRVAVRDEFAQSPEIVVIFDGQHGSVDRQDAFSDYKGQRATDAEALAPLAALADVQRGLTEWGLPWLEVPTAEADDVIATLVTRAQSQTHRPIWIMSSDRDFYQLVDEQVRVLNTAMKRGTRVIGAHEIHQRYGVSPTQWPCFTALKGDPADNIPGVRGVGAKTAATLLSDGRRLEEVFQASDFSGRAVQAVLAAGAEVFQWRELIRMRRDLELSIVLNGSPSPDLPSPAAVIERLQLW